MPPDPIAPATAPAAAAAPVSAAVTQRFAEADMLVRFKVNGEDKVVPLGEAVKDIQLSKASYEKMAKAERIMAEAKSLEEPARKYSQMMDLRQRNPSQFLEEMERLAGIQRDGTIPHEQSNPDQQAPKTRDALTDRIAAIEARQYQTDLEGDIQRTLDNYPVLRVNAKAREMAKTQIAAQLLIDQRTGVQSNIGDIARDVHTLLFDAGVLAATAERDARQQNQNSMPSIPSQIGMPDLADMPKVTAADMKTPGALGKKLLETMRRFGGQAAGNV